MTTRTPTPNRRFGRLDSAALTGAYRPADPNAVVFMAGDLDMASKEHWFNVCVGAPGRQVVVDLSATTFMDCSGTRRSPRHDASSKAGAERSPGKAPTANRPGFSRCLARRTPTSAARTALG
jgi:hypothetical protein